MGSIGSRAAVARWRAGLARRARSASKSGQALILGTLVGIGLAACSAATPATPTSAVTSSPTAGTLPSASEPPASRQPPTASQPPASAEEGSFDACALLAPADLSKIVGGNMEAGRAMPSGGWIAGQCAWNAPTSGFEISVGTAASIERFGDPATPDAKAKLAAFRQLANGTGETTTDVAGIGDGGVLAASGMAAYKGDTYIEILNLGLTDDQLVQIVKLAVAGL